jgi:hypothetical protein
MDRRFVDNPEAQALFDRCFGYAALEMRQVSFGVTADYGFGVARDRESDIPTHMKMATGGAGCSLGGLALRLPTRPAVRGRGRLPPLPHGGGRGSGGGRLHSGWSNRWPSQRASPGPGHLEARRRRVQRLGRPGRYTLPGQRRPQSTPGRTRGGHGHRTTPGGSRTAPAGRETARNRDRTGTCRPAGRARRPAGRRRAAATLTARSWRLPAAGLAVPCPAAGPALDPSSAPSARPARPSRRPDGRGLPRDLAMQEATEASVTGDVDVANFEWSGITSRLKCRDRRFRVRTDGPDGQLQSFAVKWTFNVEPAQPCCIEFPGGRDQALDVGRESRPRVALLPGSPPVGGWCVSWRPSDCQRLRRSAGRRPDRPGCHKRQHRHRGGQHC